MNSFNNQTDELLGKLQKIAVKIIDDCTFSKMTKYFGEEKTLKILLPSGDEKYFSFWVRDCAMMAESKLIPDELLKQYIEITANCGQNGEDTIYLENGLFVPPYAVADHINYDGKPVYFPGTYSSDMNQGDGSFGFFPPFCDNFYFILMCKCISANTVYIMWKNIHFNRAIKENIISNSC